MSTNWTIDSGILMPHLGRDLLLVHCFFIQSPGVPRWWPEFCLDLFCDYRRTVDRIPNEGLRFSLGSIYLHTLLAIIHFLSFAITAAGKPIEINNKTMFICEIR